jgi:hypothetical protein
MPLPLWRYLSLLIAIVICCPSYAQEAKYVFERPTNRLALVVANSEYENEAKLPGTQADADTISQILKAAGFTVTDARNVTRAQFLSLHLLPFLATVKQDDFVVFYFSGHGFSYGGENYLAPIQFPKTVAANEVFSNFISMSSVQDLISETKPGFLLMLLDACRNIAEFITPSSPTPNRIEKALALMRSPPGNIVIGYSSDLGKPSIGSSIAGQLSIYTKSLSKYLPREDVDFDKVRRDIHFDVQFETQDQQKPWFSDGSSAEIYFRPSQRLHDLERDAWLAALSTKDKKEISRFLRWYNVSRFAAAARTWLDDHKEQHSGFSRISPLGPEIAWVAPQETAAAAPIKLRRVEGPLAFSRIARTDLSGLSTISMADVVTALPFPETRPTAGLTRPAEVFAKHGEAVTTGPVAGRAKPNDRAKIVVALAANTKVAVEGYEVDTRNQTWAQVRAPGEDQSIYVAVSPTTVSRTTDIGKPLIEINVGALKGGLKSLADAKTAVEALRKLKQDGRSVEWISIATPSTPSTNTELSDLSSARAAHLT